MITIQTSARYEIFTDTGLRQTSIHVFVEAIALDQYQDNLLPRTDRVIFHVIPNFKNICDSNSLTLLFMILITITRQIYFSIDPIEIKH